MLGSSQPRPGCRLVRPSSSAPTYSAKNTISVRSPRARSASASCRRRRRRGVGSGSLRVALPCLAGLRNGAGRNGNGVPTGTRCSGGAARRSPEMDNSALRVEAQTPEFRRVVWLYRVRLIVSRIRFDWIIRLTPTIVHFGGAISIVLVNYSTYILYHTVANSNKLIHL
jgi:hypothetical protein